MKKGKLQFLLFTMILCFSLQLLKKERRIDRGPSSMPTASSYEVISNPFFIYTPNGNFKEVQVSFYSSKDHRGLMKEKESKIIDVISVILFSFFEGKKNAYVLEEEIKNKMNEIFFNKNIISLNVNFKEASFL